MKVLVTNQSIKYYSGSEINAVQICEALKSREIEADIGTFIFGSPLSQVVSKKGIKVINLLDAFDEPLNYDLVWAHHAPTLAELLYKKNISDTKIIFSSLSPIVPLECVPVFHQDIHYFLSHSNENFKVMIRDGVAAEKIHYFPNYVPEKFFSMARTAHNPVIRTVAVISNHVPAEVRDFAGIARSNNIHVTFYGFEDKQAYVDENLLLKYHLVISIGKTVQYCLGLKIPVYIYDHFGGPGYLTGENYEFSEVNNFSGRKSEIIRNGAELFEDIVTGYPKNLGLLDELFERCHRDFCLESNLDKLLSDVKGIPVTNIKTFRSRNTLAERVYASYLELQRKNLHLHNVVKAKDEEIDNTISAYTNTVSWKITEPLRKVRVLFRKKV